MRVLILGGTGNISTEVAAALADRGDEVSVVTTGRRTVPERYGAYVVDRKDEASLREGMRDWVGDVVIDFLCFTPEDCEIAYNVFRGRVSQYVFISSTVVYQKPHTTLPLTEDMPRGNEFSPYAINKIASEDYLWSVSGDEFPVTTVRPSHTFGTQWIPSPLSGYDWTVSARILEGRPVLLHGDGQSLWTLTACSDFALGMAGLVGNSAAVGETFHITSDQALTWNAIYYEIGLALGRQPEIVHIPSEFLAEHHPRAQQTIVGDKAQHGVFDNTKLKRFCPEFECQKSFRTAVRESIAWYREDEARRTITPAQDEMVDTLIAKWWAEAG